MAYTWAGSSGSSGLSVPYSYGVLGYGVTVTVPVICFCCSCCFSDALTGTGTET